MVANYLIGNIHPNPFRALDRYPIRSEKVGALRESFRATGFWGNIVARIGTNECPEISYGHHRLEALRQEYGPDKEIPLIIEDLSDDQMLKMMVRENGQDWGNSAVVDQESVRAVVVAFAQDKILLAPPPSKTAKTALRFAPSFSLGGGRGIPPDHPYTAPILAEYLGWDETKTKDTLRALELLEMGALRTTDYEDLSLAQARTLTTKALQVYKATEAGWKAIYEEVGTEEALEEARRIHLKSSEAARTVGSMLATELRSGKRGHGEPIQVPRPTVPRGLLQHARKETDEEMARRREKAREAKRERDERLEREIVRRYCEDVYWFAEGMKQILDFSLSIDSGRIIVAQHRVIRKLLEQVEDKLPRRRGAL